MASSQSPWTCELDLSPQSVTAGTWDTFLQRKFQVKAKIFQIILMKVRQCQIRLRLSYFNYLIASDISRNNSSSHSVNSAVVQRVWWSLHAGIRQQKSSELHQGLSQYSRALPVETVVR